MINNNNEPAKLTSNEIEQVARIMESIKHKPTNTTTTPPTVVEINSPPVVPETPTVFVSKMPSPAEWEKTKNSPPIELTGEMLEKVKEETLKRMANERAQREPLPAATQYALNGDDEIELEMLNIETKVTEIVKVRKMRAIDITIFKLIKSPLYSLLMGDVNDVELSNKLKLDEESMYDLVYQFITPPREVYKLAKKDMDAYHNAAIELGMKYSVNDVVKVIEAVINYIGLVNSAKAQFDTAPETDDNADLKKK